MSETESGRKFKVLFCGEEFHSGFVYTREAVSQSSLATNMPIETVSCPRSEVLTNIADADVIVPLMTKIGESEIERAQSLKMIMQFGVGLEGVDIDTATSKGIWVCNIGSEGTGNAQSCAEQAILLALSLLRNVEMMKQSLQRGLLGHPIGKTLYRSTAIVYGFGGIGKQLVQRLLAFDMNIVIIKRYSSDAAPVPASDPVLLHTSVILLTPEQLHVHPIIKQANLLFVCCSQNSQSMGFVNKDLLSHFTPGIMIVNVARGGLLNYVDVCDALHTEHVGGLGLDVFLEEPFPILHRSNDHMHQYLHLPVDSTLPVQQQQTQPKLDDKVTSMDDSVSVSAERLSPHPPTGTTSAGADSSSSGSGSSTGSGSTSSGTGSNETAGQIYDDDTSQAKAWNDAYRYRSNPAEAARYLLQHPRVVCTPHVAGVTEVSYRSMAQSVADNVLRVAQGLPPVGYVNTPHTARVSASR